jgi:hydroxyacylglutathione hydrolase
MTIRLNVKVIEVGPFITNCYLLFANREAMLIDPGDDFLRIKELIEENHVEVKKIILTHGHIDHIRAVPEAKKLTGAPVLIHSGDAGMLIDPAANLSQWQDQPFKTAPADMMIKEKDIIETDDFKLEVLHTPGHTLGGISLLTNGMVFTGDALFWGSVGRTDFPDGDHAVLIEGIKSRLLTLPDNTVVYPGHGPETTIEHERKFNPFLI